MSGFSSLTDRWINKSTEKDKNCAGERDPFHGDKKSFHDELIYLQ